MTLIASHYESRRSVGARLDDVTRDCATIMTSELSADPSSFSDRTWLAAPYTEDGQTVYALAHNEYQGHQHPGMCPQGTYEPCWYNAVTAYVSTDGGLTFAPIAAPPGHLVASPPQPFEAGAGPSGIFDAEQHHQTLRRDVLRIPTSGRGQHPGAAHLPHADIHPRRPRLVAGVGR